MSYGPELQKGEDLTVFKSSNSYITKKKFIFVKLFF